MKFKKLVLTAIIGALVCSVIACDFGLKNKDYVATSDEYFEFELDEATGEYVISASSEARLPLQVKLPLTHDGKNVTAIGKEAFKGRDITEITIPETYTEIMRDAFSDCKSLKTVKAASVKVIGNRAFCDCEQLDDFSFPAALTDIGDYAFCATKITSAKFNAVKTIGEGAFYGCEHLKNVYIPRTTKSIGEDAFGALGATVRFDVAAENEYFKVGENGKIESK